MFKKLTLIMTMMAIVSTMAFAETSSTKKKTVHKQAKHVSATPAKKQHIASKNTKKAKKKSKVA